MTALLRAGTAALLLLPGALTLFFSINDGGFFPKTVALAALIVAQILVLRVTLSENPTGGVRPVVIAVSAALALFTLWALVSQSWSDSPGRAMLESQRALLYLMVLVLFGTLPRRGDHVRWMVLGVTAAMVGICVVALITRVLPDVWPTEPNVANERLAFPLTYWNALGVMGAIAIMFCGHLSASPREPRWVQAAASAAIPLVAVTIYFTFSRGAILAGAVGAVVLVVAYRSRAVLAPLLTAAPAAAVAVVFAYDADLLATENPTTAGAIAQGKDLALVLVLCALAAFWGRLALALLGEPHRRAPVPTSRRGVRTALAVGAALFVVAGLAAGAPGRIENAVDGFVNTKAAEETGDFRDRFISPASSYRIDHWTVAWDAWREEPLRGYGAGTYQQLWLRDREVTFRVVDAHSLYVEVLSELGIVGLLALLTVIGGILAAFAARLRGPNRHLYAALFAAGVVWAIHAGIDWDWEMPATTVWFFALGGAALAARARPEAEDVHPAGSTRVLLGLGFLVVAIAPVLITLSQGRLERGIEAFGRNDCPRATQDALSSVELLSTPSEPFQLIAYCDARQGFPQLGLSAMRRAVDADPHGWEANYGLALLEAQSGRDPRPQMSRALAMNPQEVLLRTTSRALERARPAQWERIARDAQDELLASGRLPIAP